jgi:hypothetical protein
MADEEKVSVAGRSVSTASAIQSQAISMVRFNAFDEILFFMLYSLHKAARIDYTFYLFGLFCSVVNSVGISIHWLNFPLLNLHWIFVLGRKFFAWTDFSISYTSTAFLLVMLILITVCVTTNVVMLLILAFLNNCTFYSKY